MQSKQEWLGSKKQRAAASGNACALVLYVRACAISFLIFAAGCALKRVLEAFFVVKIVRRNASKGCTLRIAHHRHHLFNVPSFVAFSFH